MFRSRILVSALAIASLTGALAAPAAHAVGAGTTYIARSGTANLVEGNSCDNPNYVTANITTQIIDAVPAGNTVKFCGDASTLYTVTDTLFITKSLNFLGNTYEVGPKLVSDGNNNLFVINMPNFGDTVSFEGLAFSPAENLNNVSPSSFTNGGALRVLKGKLSVGHSAFFDFNIDGNGGAISIESTSALDRAYISNSSFIRNTAINGGAIYVADSTSAGDSVAGGADMLNITFAGNAASTKGGVAYSPNNNVTQPTSLTINHATIVNNTAPTDGALLTGSNIELRNSIVAQRLIDQTFCSDDVAVYDGNLFTNTSCGISNIFTDGAKDTSRVVRYAQLQLGHYQSYPFPAIAIYPGSVAIDFITASTDTTTQDIHGRNRSNDFRDAGAFEFNTVQNGGDVLPVVARAGYIHSIDETSDQSLIDAYRFGRPNYRLSSLDYAAYVGDEAHPLNNIQYTSLTPTKCTLPSNTSLADLDVPAIPASQGWCTIEAYHPGTLTSGEFVAYINLRIYYGTRPTEPRNIVVSSRETSVHVAFAAPSDTGAGIDSYQLRVNGANSFERIATCNAIAFTCEVTGLTRSTAYTVTMMVNSTGGLVTQFTLGSTRTLQQKMPSVVQSLTLKASPAKSITVTWKAPKVSGRTALTSYMVRLYLASKPTKTLLVKTVKLKSPKIVFNKLKSKTKYLVRVIAYNDDGYYSKLDKTITVK